MKVEKHEASITVKPITDKGINHVLFGMLDSINQFKKAF